MEGSVNDFAVRLCRAVPRFEPLLEEYLREPGGFLPYAFMMEVGGYARSAFMSSRESGAPLQADLVALMKFLESEFSRAPESVDDLIHMGFLESLGGPPKPYWRVRELLGPRMRRRIEEIWPSEGVG